MEKLLELLNLAFEMEYVDVFLYLKEAGMFKKKIVAGEKLAKIFEEFSQMELIHADRLAMKIIELGGKAHWTFRTLEPSSSLREVLKKHLESETKAYHLYSEIIKITEELDFNLILKGIREDEKEHIEKVTDILKKLK
ncbi:MAG TPA: hypothetical protein DHV62_08330 [Elusimicrobia bacterium]|jgi:bacterioferritin (cytochrome b1)|nr:hypothetical protein [Elusimicrobiota bacterium]